MAVTNWVGGDGTGTQQTDWTRAANWDNGVPGSGDDAVIGNVTHDPTIPDGTDPTLGSIQVTTGGQLTAGNNVITLDDVDGSGLAFYLNGTGAFIKGTSTITFTDSSNQYIAINTSNANRTFYNVTVNKTGSGDVYIYQSRDGSSNEPLVISNNLTTTARGFSTANDSSSPSAYYDLTVGNVVTVNGTLTGNSSTLTFGSLKGTGTFNAPTTTVEIDDRDESTGKAIDVDAMTIAANDLNVTLTSAKNQDLDIGDDKIHDLTINNDTDARINYLSANGSIDGTLTITRGIFNTFNRDLEVDESIQIQADGTLEANANGNKPVKAGAIQIASGGIYNGTSDTTEITSGAYTGTWGFQNSGTYNHNKGTIKITSTENPVHIQSYYFYNITVAMGDSTDATKFRDGGLPAGTSGEIVILGNLIIEEGKFIRDTKGDDLIVHGLVEVQGGAQFGEADESGDNTFNSLVVNRGTFATGTGANNFNGGIRALSAITSDDTITINGTGGLLEGTLDDALVNVNLDPALVIDSSDDKITTGNLGSLGQASSISSFAWVKFAATPSTSMYIWSTLYQPCNFYMGASNKLGFQGKRASDDGTESVVMSGTYTFVTDVWYHVGFSYNNSSRAVLFYINGVEYAGGTLSGALKNVNTDLILGNYGAGSNFLNGNIADVKIFNTVVNEAGAKILASKINQDPNTTAYNSNVIGWWKINEGSSSIADFTNDTNGGTDHNGTLANGSWDYDAFSVNVQDTLTTDGNFKVTQGKVEGLSLSTPNLNGSADYFQADSSVALVSSLAVGTISAWFKTDEVSNRTILFSASDKSEASEDLTIDKENGTGKMEFFVRGGSSSVDFKTTNQYNDDKWHHLVITVGTGGNAIYIDGTLAEGAYSVGSSSTQAFFSNLSGLDTLRIGNREDSGGNEYFWEDNIRDVRIYDYDLSADQVASLYSNSYNVTPKLWWKMDDGTTNIQGSGTASAHAMSGEGGIDWTNGTLDLDNSGALTIQTNGIFSAPRGTCQVAGDITGGGKIIHNNGTFESNRASSTVNFDFSGSGVDADGNAQPMFYDVLCTSATTKIIRDTSIARELHIDSAATFKFNCNSRAVTLTMGTSSSAGEIHQDGGGFQFENNTSNAAKIVAADTSGLNPWTNVSGYNIDWDSGGSGSDVELANGNYSGSTATGGGGVTVKLTGDMKFGALTVTDEDTLDVDGQRMHTTGTVDINGNLKMGAGMWYAEGDFDTSNGAVTEEEGATFLLEGDNYIHNNDGSFVGDANTHILLQGDKNTYLNSFESGGYAHYVGNLTVGKGTATLPGPDRSGVLRGKANNITVATGATLAPSGDQELTCLGDFTTSGGLIGKSAAVFNGSSQEADFGDPSEFELTSTMTIEAWIKPESTSGLQGIVGKILFGSAGNKEWGLSSEDSRWFFKCGNASSNGTAKSSSTFSTGKWYHIAATKDSSGVMRLYVNGKQDQLSVPTVTGDCNPTYNFIMGRRASNVDFFFDGTLGLVRIFNTERTQAQIRADMFNDFSNMDSTTGLVACYQFDTGTGTTIYDSTSNDLDSSSSDATWAGNGAYTLGSSTLVMAKSGTQYIYGKSGLWLNNLTVNDGSTTKLSLWNGNSNHQGDLITVGTGVFESDNNETVYLRNAGDTITVGTAATGIAGIHGFITALGGGSLSFPACTVKSLTLDGSGDTVSGGGDMIFTSKLQIKNGTEFSCNGKSHTAYTVDLDGTGRINLNGASLTFSNTAGLTSEVNSTIAASNTTITGVAGKSTFQSQNNWELVGTVENLDVTNEELNVTGKVINCTGEIHQWHNTIDSNQQLDRDTADDRDINLGRDLDKNTELVG